jgi:hypothetical protein
MPVLASGVMSLNLLHGPETFPGRGLLRIEVKSKSLLGTLFKNDEVGGLPPFLLTAKERRERKILFCIGTFFSMRSLRSFAVKIFYCGAALVVYLANC